MKTKINLGWRAARIPKKIQNARIYASNLEDHPNDFPDCNVTPFLLREAASNLETWYAIAKKKRSMDIAKMHDAEDVLKALVVKLSHYAEDLPNNSPELAAMLGFKAKGKGGNKKARFTAKHGKYRGCISLRSPAVKKACYHWEVFQGIEAPGSSTDKWTCLGFSTTSYYNASDLIRDKRYWFRVRSIVGQKAGVWSAPICIIVM